MVNQLNMVPSFTSDDGSQPTEVITGTQEEGVDETSSKEAAEAPAEEEKETPTEPPAVEKPAGQKPAQDTRRSVPTVEQLQALEKAVNSLQEERVKILREMADLRGQRREIKQERLDEVNKKIDDLKDVHPEDAAVIEKVLRAKGYIRKDEANQMFYDSVKNEELSKFFEKYPEYKPENDPNDLNWQSLQKELGFYRTPDDPHLVGQLLERAHRAISGTRTPSGRGTVEKKRQIEVAGMGSGGTQRPSSGGKSLDPHKRAMLSQGGWSEEEIKKIEQNIE